MLRASPNFTARRGPGSLFGEFEDATARKREDIARTADAAFS